MMMMEYHRQEQHQQHENMRPQPRLASRVPYRAVPEQDYEWRYSMRISTVVDAAADPDPVRKFLLTGSCDRTRVLAVRDELGHRFVVTAATETTQDKDRMREPVYYGLVHLRHPPRHMARILYILIAARALAHAHTSTRRIDQMLGSPVNWRVVPRLPSHDEPDDLLTRPVMERLVRCSLQEEPVWTSPQTTTAEAA